uniref:Levopimaradiene synthase n=1 Tax=Ginkgo biloba TaxID=3311 RepID=A0A1S6KJR3_GINBI|nr:levopimaradiene synthase [Ginkgo biloba]
MAQSLSSSPAFDCRIIMASSVGVSEQTYSESVVNSMKTFDASTLSRLTGPELYPPTLWKDDFIESLRIGSEAFSDDNDNRIETLITEIKAMFCSMSDGEISPSAYDTAWIARVSAIDGFARPQFPQALEWVLNNQLADGSWGEESVFLAYDRVLNTLASVITLKAWNTGNVHVQKGLDFIRKHAEEMVDEAENHTRPSKFDMVFPAMLNDAKSLGLNLPYELPVMKQIAHKREAKLKEITIDVLHSVPTALLSSLEGLQDLVLDWRKILKLQSNDGSLLNSPAATACAFMHTGDKKCLEFLSFVLSRFGDHVPCIYPVDLFERLWAVDTVERLGIDRHFKTEIKEALDYVYRYWDERGMGFARESPVADIGVTAMGLRLLRLHGYDVSSDVLVNFKDENGEFLDSNGPAAQKASVSDMLNLFRCSQVTFPGEKLMQEASAFSKSHLRIVLQNKDNTLFPEERTAKKRLCGEVEYALDYPWHRNLPRVEARSYMEQYGINDLWVAKTVYRMPYVTNGKYLELAKLDFNKVQSLHRAELKQITRWWKACGFTHLTFTRQRPVEIFFSASATLFEPEFAACRIAYTKSACLAVILDDLYDAHASLQDAMLFTKAVKRWDLSLLDCLPGHMKICFLGLYNTINELGEQGLEAHGWDVLRYLRNVWESLLACTVKEAEWAEAKHVPPFQEYLQNGKVSVALATLLLHSVFFTGELLPEHILSELDFRSNFLHLVCLTGRLVNDARTFKDERDRGELASSIQCYIKDNPGCTEEEALNRIYDINESGLAQLNSEFVKPEPVLECYRKLLFNTARAAQLFYRNKDGFGMSVEDMEELVKKFLFENVA